MNSDEKKSCTDDTLVVAAKKFKLTNLTTEIASETIDDDNAESAFDDISNGNIAVDLNETKPDETETAKR